MSSTDGAPDPTLARAASGYRSTLVSQAVRVICKVAGVVVLARLVSPAGHGLFAMAATLTYFLTLFRDFGTSTAAIQTPQLAESEKTALWRLQLALGFVLAVATCALAPFVASFYHEPSLTRLLAVMSAGFVLNGINSWPRTLLQRELRFSELNRVETWGAILGTIAMIATGALGGGPYSFATFLLVSELVMLVLAWRACEWRSHATPDWRQAAQLGRTGMHLTGYNLLLYFLQQADTLVLGRWFGATPLGLYNRAAQLLVQPSLHLAWPYSQVLLATLARLGVTSADFARHLRETANAIAYFTLPFAALCIAIPEPVIRLVLGPDWLNAAPLLRWLAVAAAANFLGVTIQPLCVAAGQFRRLTHMAAVTVPATLLCLWVGRASGPVGIAAGMAVASAGLLLPRLAWAAKGTPVQLRVYLSAFIRPIALSTLFGASLCVGTTFAGNLDPRLAILPSLVIGGAAAALGAWLWPGARLELREILQHLPFGRAKA